MKPARCAQTHPQQQTSAVALKVWPAFQVPCSGFHSVPSGLGPVFWSNNQKRRPPIVKGGSPPKKRHTRSPPPLARHLKYAPMSGSDVA